MNKKMKRILAVSSVVAVPLIATPVVALTSVSIINNKESSNISLASEDGGDYKYLYGGKYYDSYDDIVDGVLNNSNSIINKNLYYGNINDSIFDQESKRINIANMRLFDPSNPDRISEAWINALGQHTISFDDAKRSYINEGLIQYKYIDMEGNLFSSYSEADNSNKKGVKFDEIAFYEIQNAEGETIRINPLNKNDVEFFKELAINEILYKNNSNFSYKLLKPRDKSKILSDDGSTEFVEDTSGLLNLTISNDDGGLISMLNDILTRAIQNYLQNLRVDVRINLLNKNSHLSNNYYVELSGDNTDKNERIKITSSLTGAGNSYTKDKRDLIIKNVRLKDLSIFEPFLVRDLFYKTDWQSNEKIKIRTWSQKYQGRNRAREAEISLRNLWDDNSNDEMKFKILCYGSGDSGYAGNDNDIMQDGTNHWLGYPQLYFSVQVLADSLKNRERNELGDFVNCVLNEVTGSVDSNQQLEDSIKEILTSFINADVMNKLIRQVTVENNGSDIKKIFDNIFNAYSKPDKANNNILKYFKDETFSLFSNKKNSDILLGQRIWDFGNLVNCNNDLNNVTNISKDIITSIVKLFESERICIFYKDSPIFFFEPKSDFISDNYLSFDNGETILENIVKNKESLVLENIINVSNSIWNVRSENTSNYDIESENNKRIIIYQTYSSNKISSFVKIENNREIINIDTDQQYKPNSWTNSSGQNYKQKLEDGINGAFYCYNQNVINLDNSSYQKYKEKSKINIDDILVLRDVDIENEIFENTEAVYAKFLKLGSYSPNNFNPAFSDNESKVPDTRIVLNERDEATLRNNSTKIKPSKIVLVYDITGKVVNPGINADGIADTSNDALYDSERNILDNLYRTTIVKKDPKMIYYENDDGTHTLIENSINWIYNLVWENKINYFVSYNDAKNYLREQIKLDTVKVKI